MKIFYTGIGCHVSGHHKEEQFLDIMKREFQYKTWRYELAAIPREDHYQLQFNDWVLPDDFVFFTINDWIEYSGAEIVP